MTELDHLAGGGRAFDYGTSGRSLVRVQTDGHGRLTEEVVRPLRAGERIDVSAERQLAAVVFVPLEEEREPFEDRLERVVCVLRDEGPLPVRELADLLGLMRTEASYALARLKEDGRVVVDDDFPPRWRLTQRKE